MSGRYYLIPTEPTPPHGRIQVSDTHRGKALLWQYEPAPEWEDAEWNWDGPLGVPAPIAVADLKALVASGRYRFVDECGVDRGVEEVFR